MPAQPPPDDRSSLEAARERLYAPSAPSAPAPGTSGRRDRRALPHAWLQSAKVRRVHPHLRLAGIFFFSALLFFLLALAAAAYLLYFGGNSVSVNNVDVQLQGPTAIAGGDAVPLSLAITNRNPIPIENAELEVDFPQGTRSADDVLKDYPRYTENLGTIAPGTTVARTLRAVIFGGEGQQASIPISVSFTSNGSSATFVKKTAYALSITSTPLSVSIDAPAEAVSGQPLSLSFTVRSNASAPLQNVVAQIELPFGFSLASSSVPLSGSAVILGTLAPGASRSILLSGTLSAEDGASRAFQVTVGTAGAQGSAALAVPYLTQSATIAVAAPFIRTTFSINGDSSGAAVVEPGATAAVSLGYANTLASAVANATLEVVLSGDAVDYASVRAANGFYQSATHTLVFSRDTDPALASLAPGASGSETFTFSVLPASAAVRAPAVTLTASVSGMRVGETSVPERVSSSASASVKVVAAPALFALSRHASGPFPNTGPVPPSPGAATTYTIEWRASASGTALADALVSAALPSYVSYTGKTSGAGALSYDPSARTVSWNAGDIAAGASVSADFQVSLLPSASQKNSVPALTAPATLSAFDRYTQTAVSATIGAATTETKSDPGYSPTWATVQ